MKDERDRAERRARLLADVSLTLNASVDDLDGALDVAVGQIGAEIGETCSIYLLSEDGRWLDCVAQSTGDPAQRALAGRAGVRGRRFSIDGNALGDVVRTATTRFSPRTPGSVREIVGATREDLSALRAFGNIMVPLRARDRAIGLISVTRTVPDLPEYTDDDRAFLEELAARAAVAIDAARLYRAAEQATAALRASERRLRAMFDSTRVGIVARDADGCVVECNRAYAAMLGFDPGELIGTEYAGIIDPAELEAGRRRNRDAFAAGVDNLEFEHGYRRRDGSTLHARVTASFVRDADGVPLYSLALVEDLSERHRLEQQLLQSQKMDAVGRLAGGIAHDFNNVLTAIIGFSDMIAAGVGGAHPAQAQASEIRAAAERGHALTRQLLAFSRRQVLSREELAPDEVIERLVPMLRRLVGEDIALELALDPAAGPVRADRGQLEQVIVNLAVNARDAMPGGGRLTLATSGFDADPEFARLRLGIEPGPLVVIAVSDTGHGMDAETQEHIFEPFFTTKAPSAGTGLGLATAYGIVSQSEGSISVYSEPGHGTTFRIHLPRVAQARDAVSAEPEAASREAPVGGTETILLAEDDQAIRGLIRLILEDGGYCVLSAATPAEALAIAAERHDEIDLIVSDMVMPGLSGPELAVRIREYRTDIAVLFTSGYSSDEIVRRGLERDVPFIEKPFTPDALLHKVREVLSLSRRADAPSARSSRRS